MTTEELFELLEQVQKMKCETNTLELKSAASGCPKRLYDTFSSFSNQDEGGTIVFGVKEEDDYNEVGVYDVHDLQKKINEQALQMVRMVSVMLFPSERRCSRQAVGRPQPVGGCIRRFWDSPSLRKPCPCRLRRMR